MMRWMKSKLAAIMIAAVAVFTIAGVSAAFAAQGHTTTTSLHAADGASQQQENQFEAQGVIQQVTFDQGTTKSGSLVFLPSGKQATVTVTFTTTTKIAFEGDNSGSSDGQNASAAQQNTLAAGMSAKVEGTLQADGSVAAKEIQANAKSANENDGNGDNNEQGEHTFVGVIQSVDTTAQTFVLLPDGQTTPVTIAFDAKTNVEDQHDDGNQSGSTSGIVAGAHVEVEAITRADGSLYAKEVKPASGEDGSGENGGDGDGHNGTPTPTPGTGSGDNGGNGGSGSGDNGSGDNGGNGGSGSGSSGS